MSMDCDQVFMILTRGPFPSGDPSDEQVEDHLETCADCWRLAEALRPAGHSLGGFQEAVPTAECQDLPGYWGDARPAAFGQPHPSAARIALMAGGRPAPTPYYGHKIAPLSHGFPVDLVRAAVLLSTLSATAVGLLLLWRVW
jgi:hypothetical protein